MAKRRKAFGFRYFTVFYAWIENHQEKRAHTAVEALDLPGAWRKFKRENPQAVVVDSLRVPDDPMSIVNLRVRLNEQRLQLAG